MPISPIVIFGMVNYTPLSKLYAFIISEFNILFRRQNFALSAP